ncbi:hypothetical protein [Dactylosporangium darangshiense]|uniref:DUF4190 domain-containing protein n=1 Tax=Dactylosporangium darangshiense TaxID=579108 RepID=A0ABP8D6Q9_9ACTN
MGYPGYPPQQPPSPYGRPVPYGQQPPPYGYPHPYGVPTVPPAPVAAPAMRVDVVQGTPFGVAYPTIQSVPSGQATGSLVAGIASVLVALFAVCLGATGAEPGWGLAASGAFTILGVFLGGGAVGLAVYGLRQIRRAAGQGVTGKGMAVTGIVLGAVGAGLALLALLIPLAVV